MVRVEGTVARRKWQRQVQFEREARGVRREGAILSRVKWHPLYWRQGRSRKKGRRRFD